jgi:hypothetical protein
MSIETPVPVEVDVRSNGEVVVAYGDEKLDRLQALRLGPGRALGAVMPGAGILPRVIPLGTVSERAAAAMGRLHEVLMLRRGDGREIVGGVIRLEHVR